MTNIRPNQNTINGKNCPSNYRQVQTRPQTDRPNNTAQQRVNTRPQNTVNRGGVATQNIRRPQNTYNPEKRVSTYIEKPSKIENAAIAVAETIGEARVLMADAKAVSSSYKVKTVKVKERKPIPIKLIFFSLVCTLLAMFMVVSFVQINEVTLEIDKINRKIKTVDAEARELTLELERKNNLYAVEEYASEKLGMIKGNQLKVIYLENEGEDTIDNFETEEEDKGVISTILSAIGNNFKSYWNIFYKSE